MFLFWLIKYQETFNYSTFYSWGYTFLEINYLNDIEYVEHTNVNILSTRREVNFPEM